MDNSLSIQKQPNNSAQSLKKEEQGFAHFALGDKSADERAALDTAGVFPDFNIKDIHSDTNNKVPKTEEKEHWLVRFAGSKFVKNQISLISNVCDFTFNTAAAIANILPLPKAIQEKATSFASKASKATLFFYDFAAAVTQIFKAKNLMTGLSYLTDMLFVTLFKQKDLYTMRGITMGLNLWSFGSSYYDANKGYYNADKKSFNSFKDCINSIIPNLKKASQDLSFKHIPKTGNAFKKIIGYAGNVINNLFSKKSGMLYIISGLGMVLGTLLAQIKPLEAVGKAFRNAIGVVPDFARFRNPKTEPNNFKAGISFIASAFMNSARIGEASKKLESIVVPLEFAFNSLARHFHLMSQNYGETTDTVRSKKKKAV